MVRLTRLLPLLVAAALLAPLSGAAAPLPAAPAAAPPADAIAGEPGTADTTDTGITRCWSGVGVIVDTPVRSVGSCVVVTWALPSDLPPDPLFPNATACPEGEHGMNTTYLNTTASLCYSYAARAPNLATGPCPSTPNLSDCFGYSLTDCEVPANVDPAVYLLNGYVIACANVYVEPPEDLGLDIDGDLTPCPGGFDPVVYVNDGYVRICLHVIA